MRKALLFLLLFQAGANLIGALGPELGFDALWYHLTIPKLWMSKGFLAYIPGGLLYYSVMPRLTEVLYFIALKLQGYQLAKLVHFLFGLLSAFMTYKIGRKFVNREFSLFAVVIFYTTLVVGWLSISTYIDLARTFFEVTAFYFLSLWWTTSSLHARGGQGRRELILSAIFMGLALSTKHLTLGSLAISASLIFLRQRRLFALLIYIITAVLVVFPWYLAAYMATGNPLYPIGSGILDPSNNLPKVSFFSFFGEFVTLILKPADPLSPLYLIFLPLVIWYGWLKRKEIKKESPIFLLFAYAFLGYVVWYLTPRTGGGRFIVPYLPMWAILCVASLEAKVFSKQVVGFGKVLILLVAIFHIVYRMGANAKFVPYILGKESEREFLCKHLPFETSVFYDCDGFFAKIIKPTDKVLIYGTHNLFYVNFPFEHESWAKPCTGRCGVKAGDKFTYVMTQNSGLPKKYDSVKLIYTNARTGVKLYKL